MPTCSKCGEPAFVFVSFVKAGKVTKICLCQKHADETESLTSDNFGLLNVGNSAEPTQSPDLADVLCCEVCGFTRKDFEKSGRFGCPACYETFGSFLRPVFEKLHSGSKHMGKIPAKAMAESLINDRIRHLEVKMEQAVASERYEDAACFRDKITAVKQLSTNSSVCKVAEN